MPRSKLAKLLRVIDGTKCIAVCPCGVEFTASRDEDGEPGEECCYYCSEAGDGSTEEPPLVKGAAA